MFGFRSFGDSQLERLYRHGLLHQSGAQLVVVLCVFTSALLMLALSHLLNPDLVLLLSTASAAIALGLNILLNVQSPARQHGTIATIGVWLCASVLCMMAAGGLHALLPTLIAYFSLYTLFPFDLSWTVAMALGLSLAQLISAILIPMANSREGRSQFTIEQLLAVILVHAWANFIGVYLFWTRRAVSRAVFLNARNAHSSGGELGEENSKMAMLLSSALPTHIIASVQSQIGGVDVPKVYVEHYAQVSVMYAKLYGLQPIIQQISVQDAARLLSELDSRVWLLANFHQMTVVQSDAIVLIAGAPSFREDHATIACQIALDLIAIIRSFCDATSADLHLKVGIGSGSISAGIIGAKRWHYDAIGMAVDAAMHLERSAPPNGILISEDTRRLVADRYAVERIDYASWRLLHPVGTAQSRQSPQQMPAQLLFPVNQRRFSLLTLPQAINRLLQQAAAGAGHPSVAATVVAGNTLLGTPVGVSLMHANGTHADGAQTFGRRKRKEVKKASDRELCARLQDESDWPLLSAATNISGSQQEKRASNYGQVAAMNCLSQRFVDVGLEAGFFIQADRWFIPGLAISIAYLVVYGLFQMLVMPRLLVTLGLVIAAMVVMFVVLMALYLNYFESFCQFVTRTPTGHSTAILLVLAVLFTCGTANTFSCPTDDSSTVCQPVHFAVVGCAVWMLAAAVFVRFPSLYLLASLFMAIVIYAIHVFGTHAKLYRQFSITTVGWNVQVDVLIQLATLALLIYLQARRNERMIRMDYLSVIKTVDDSRQLERIDYLNEQILLNALPTHIAYTHGIRVDPYSHLCQSVGILAAKLGQPDDWHGEFGFDRLNRVVYELDQQLVELAGTERLEKVRTAHCVYTVAVGMLPEIVKNVHDAPCTIGDLLAALANFAFRIERIAENEGIDVAIGIDCGPALSVVVGGDRRPRYELVGTPNARALKLMDAAAAIRVPAMGGGGPMAAGETSILVSEDIFLALRPRTCFYANERSAVSVAPGLTGFLLQRPPPPAHYLGKHKNNYGQETPTDQPQRVPPPPAPRAPSEYATPMSHIEPVMRQPMDVSGEQGKRASKILEERQFAHRDEGSSAESASPAPLSGDEPEEAEQHFRDAMDDEEDVHQSGAHNGTRAKNEKCTDGPSVDPLLEQSPCTSSAALLPPIHPSALNKKGTKAGKRSPLPPVVVRNNPLEMFTSMHSSFSSELYSVDLSVETDDSELEWITPEMIANNEFRPMAELMIPSSAQMSPSAIKRLRMATGTVMSLANGSGHHPSYKGDQARQYSDFSEAEAFRSSSRLSSARMRRKKYQRPSLTRNGPKLPKSWLNSQNQNNINNNPASNYNTSGNTSMFSSDLSLHNGGPGRGSVSALDRLNAAARRVDRMLKELANVDGETRLPDCVPFPIAAQGVGPQSGMVNGVASPKSVSKMGSKSGSKREMSSACHTEYDNADSADDGDSIDEGANSDPELMSRSRLEQLKKALRCGIGSVLTGGRANNNGTAVVENGTVAANGTSAGNAKHRFPLFASKPGNPLKSSHRNLPSFVADPGNDADIDSSCCSSLASSMVLDKMRWKSVHSIGYENEYEFNSEANSLNLNFDDQCIDNPSPKPYCEEFNGAISKVGVNGNKDNQLMTRSVGQNADFVPMDASSCSADEDEERKRKEAEEKRRARQLEYAKAEMEQLSRDIRRNFGEFQLATFSDMDNASN